jgi:hypothetical protein
MSSTVNNEACASVSSPRISSFCQVGLGQGLGEDDLGVAIPQFPDCMGRQSAAVVYKCLSARGCPAKKRGTWFKNSEELSLSSETFWIWTDFSVSFRSSVHSRVMISFSSHHRLPFTTETNFWCLPLPALTQVVKYSSILNHLPEETEMSPTPALFLGHRVWFWIYLQIKK